MRIIECGIRECIGIPGAFGLFAEAPAAGEALPGMEGRVLAFAGMDGGGRCLAWVWEGSL